MKLITSTILAAALAGAAFGQSTNAYFFVAPGGVTGSAKTEGALQLGAGGEIALPKSFGAGVEAGAISPFRSWGDATLGTFAVNGYYHFVHRDRRIHPFVTAGYTVFFRDGHVNLFNFGGGANLWATRHLGARIELRDQVATYNGTLHYWGVRLGLAFR
jgi:hypothetical protein